MTETEVKQQTVGNGHEANAPALELTGKIIEQIEYYFGDINLPRDKFLQEEIKKDEGWVPLSTMLKFNRLTKLCDDADRIAQVLQDSLLIHVSDDNQKIRRNPEIPLPENSLEYWQEVKNRTVYVKGFPADAQLDEIMEFVHAHGPVKNILMRRVKGEKTFKGSVFITFGDKESAQKFVNNGEVSQFKDQPLLKMMQMDYWVKKNQENKERREAARSLKQAKNKEVQDEAKKNLNAPTFIKGIILRIHGIPKEKLEKEQQNGTIKALKEFFRTYGEVAYVALVEGQDDKVDIRFKTTEENFATKAWENAVKAAGEKGKPLFQNAELEGNVLEGEEEQRYWAEFTKGALAAHERGSNRNRGGGGRGRGRGGRGGGGRGGRKGGANDGPGGKRTVFKDSDEEEGMDQEPSVKKDSADEAKGSKRPADNCEEQPDAKKGKD